MKTATVEQMKTQFGAYLKATAKGPVIVTRNGKPAAALIGIDAQTDLQSLVKAPKQSLRELLHAADQRISAGHGIAAAEFWRELDRKYESSRKPRRRRVVNDA